MENPFSMLPNKVDEMMKQLSELASQLTNQTKKASPKKLLNIDEAVECLVMEGYLVSKSTIYKCTSKRTIPHERFGGRLVFDRQKLINWCKEKTTFIENKI